MQQQFADRAEGVDAVAVLGIGIQDTPRGSALLALRARTTADARHVVGMLDDAGSLVLAMTVRGAPHVIARRDLALFRAALRPLADSEAADLDVTARVMSDVVAAAGRMSRPELSGALNPRVPERVRAWCERCGSRHVREDLFRQASLQAGLILDPEETSPIQFVHGALGDDLVPAAEDARAELARRFVRLVGPTRPDELARWLGTDGAGARPVWDLIADELARVDVDGRRCWMLRSDVEALTGAEAPDTVRLLPPSDPYLLGDRSRLVPQREDRATVWRPLASPGVVLDGHELVGTWRQRMVGDTLEITVSPFGRLRRAVRTALDGEAEAVAAVRGAHHVALNISRKPPQRD